MSSNLLEQKLSQWCLDFKMKASQQLSKETMMALGTLIWEEKQGKMIDEEFLSIPAYMLVDKRSGMLGLELTAQCKAFLTLIGNGSPGTMVMYLSYLAYQFRHRPLVSLETMAWEFPYGFPSPNSLKDLWENQRLSDGRNLLDQVHLFQGRTLH